MSDDELDELDVGNEEDVEETLLEDDLAGTIWLLRCCWCPALTCYLSMVCVGIDVSILSRAASNREPVVDLDLSSHWPSDL